MGTSTWRINMPQTKLLATNPDLLVLRLSCCIKQNAILLRLKPWSRSWFCSDSRMTHHIQPLRNPASCAFRLYWEFSHFQVPSLLSPWSSTAVSQTALHKNLPASPIPTLLTYSLFYVEARVNCLKFERDHVISPLKILRRLPFLNQVKSQILSVACEATWSTLASSGLRAFVLAVPSA